MEPYAVRLRQAIDQKGCPIAVGIDPRPDRLPGSLRSVASAPALGGIETFCLGLIDCVAPVVPAVKIQVAFFERFRAPGLDTYFRLLAAARRRGLLVIGDVKRGDIGSTAEAYADAHLSGDDAADAITINPYFGTDGVSPFLTAAARSGRGLYVLVKTSNPSSAELQDLRVGNGPLHESVAALVSRWGAAVPGDAGYTGVGAVVGGTHPEILARARRLLPHSPLLVPGYGAQGARARDVAVALDREGQGALIAASRSIAQAFECAPLETGWQDAARRAAEQMREEIREATAAGR